MLKSASRFLAPALTLALLTACGGGSVSSPGPAPVPSAVAATGFAYTDPAEGGWRLVKDPSSTATRLVLNLVGPVGTKSRGVGFNLQAPSAVVFGTFPNLWHAQDAGVFDLLNHHRPEWDLPASPEPVFFAAGVKTGNVLTVGIFQKDRLIDAKAVAAPVVQIALEFDAARAAQVKAGDVLALALTKARHVPEDIGRMNQDGTYDEGDVLAKSKPVDIQIGVGVLKGI